MRNAQQMIKSINNKRKKDVAVGIPESSQARFRRYQNCASRMLQWRNLLQESYDYTLPGRVNFNKENPGSVRSERIFNSVPVQSVQMFSNNIQSMLMPPNHRWAILKAGTAITTNKIVVEQELQQVTRILFDYLRRSNFDQVVNSSLQDMAISTGMVMLNEGTDDNPFIFHAISIDQICFDANPFTGKIENVWRKLDVKGRDIKRLWKNAIIPQSLENTVENNPDEKVSLIEGVIYYPYHGSEWWYYVQTGEGSEDLVTEKRDYNPWNALRWNIRTGEIVGYGPVLEILSHIKVLNTISELELKAANFRAVPPYIGIDSASWNVNFARLEPGSILPVGPEFIQNDPLRPIPNNGNPEFTQILSERIEEAIRHYMFADPLPPMTSGMRTATEIEIRNQNWLRSSGTAFTRIRSEFIQEIIRKCLKILSKKGLIPDIKLDGKIVDIEYDSPLTLLQGQEDFDRMQQYVQFFAQIGGAQLALALTKLDDMPELVSGYLGVDKRIVPSAAQIQSIKQKLGEAAQAAISPQNIGTSPDLNQQTGA